jgi:predicted dinucleotide-binding enzyme
MTTLGIIGAGNIGQALARVGLRAGYDVVISNSRGPETLAQVVGELSASEDARATVRAATAAQAAEAADLAVVTIPLKAVGQVPAEPLAGKVVIDTNNYYPQRDGQIAELDDESTTTAELLQRHLPTSRVVKAFNHIGAQDIVDKGTPAGTPHRRALAIAGDDAAAKAQVLRFIDEIGFDVVDLGSLAEGWRIQRDTPGYGAVDDADQLRAPTAEAKRYREM